MPAKTSKKPSAESEKVYKKVTVRVQKNVGARHASRGDLSVDVYDMKGNVAGSVLLPKEVFGAKVNPSLMAQAVRVYLANQRKGTVSTKTRGEVAGSTRKIYRQKGTGRARHGSIRAPIFVHGGVVFGPKPRDYSLSFSKKMRRAALFSALSIKQKEKAITVVRGLEKVAPKTKVMIQALKSLGVDEKKRKLLLILPKNLENVKRAARNIAGVRIAPAENLNTYNVLLHPRLLVADSAIDVLKNHFVPVKA